MGKEISTFCNIEIEKNKFYYHKTRIFFSGDVDSEKTLPSHRILLGEINYR